jgi:hypothetical protein
VDYTALTLAPSIGEYTELLAFRVERVLHDVAAEVNAAAEKDYRGA